MNILLLTNYFPPEIGSASHLFYELAESLVKKKHRVTVVTGFPRYNVKEIPGKYRGKLFLREELNGIHVVRVGTVPLPRTIPIARGLDHFIALLRLFSGGLLAGKQDISLVYSPPLTLGISAYFLRKIAKIPFVFNVQDLFPQSPIDLGLLKSRPLIRMFEAIERFIYKRANYITVHSEGNRAHIITKGATEDRVVVIHNWVDTEMIKPSEKMNEFRQEHKLDAKFVVSFAGVMGYSQGLGIIIESAELLKAHKDILFLLVGDGIEKEKLELEAKKLKLNNVKFLPMQPREKYPSVLYASDVCLVTLSKEVVTPVVPSKLLSIMAAGRPVAASLNLDGDAPKIVEAAQCGYCVEPENPEALAEAILKLYNDKSLGEEFGKNGRVYAEKHFSRKACVEKYERLFLEAYKRQNNSRSL